MDRAEIQAMPDRELDAWIAEHVMGASVKERDGEIIASFFSANGAYMRQLGVIEARPWSGTITRFNPTTDANAMLTVLGQLSKRDFDVRITMCDHVTVSASVDPGGPYQDVDWITIGYAIFRDVRRLPRAVCEAAAEAAMAKPGGK